MTAGDTSYLLLCSCLVFIMIPGLGYFYSGLTSSKSALSILLLCFLTYSIVLMQWFMFGYSLVFSKDGGPFIGSLYNGGFANLDASGVNSVYPDFAFAFFQSTFAGITPALVVGAGAENARLLPKIVFIFIWTTLVYDFIAYWNLNANGWLNVAGALDFAGGSSVHIASGSAALAFTLMLGKTKQRTKSVAHSPANVLLGTLFLWFGWNGFNGGSALSSGARASAAVMATNLAAAGGSLAWMLLTYFKTKKFSAIAFCCGAIAGLVSITPAAGFINPGYGLLIGIIGATVCYLGVIAKEKLELDDTLDVFTIHGIGGIIGNLLTGIFAERKWPMLSNETIKFTGLVEGGDVLKWQLAASLVCFLWSFGMTCIILAIINRIPGLSLKLEAAELIAGIDAAEMGETTYDYVKALNAPKVQTREFGTWTGQRPGWGLKKIED